MIGICCLSASLTYSVQSHSKSSRSTYFPMPSIVVTEAPLTAHNGNKHYKIKINTVNKKKCFLQFKTPPGEIKISERLPLQTFKN